MSGGRKKKSVFTRKSGGKGRKTAKGLTEWKKNFHSEGSKGGERRVQLEKINRHELEGREAA